MSNDRKGNIIDNNSVNILLAQSEIKSQLDKFVENELKDARYLLMIYIGSNGKIYTRNAGMISDLEYDGLRYNMDEILCEMDDINHEQT